MSPKTMRRRSAAGFNLLELLILITTAAFLGFLLLPVKKKSCGSKHVHCMNNAKQISVAVSLFMTENHGYPLATNSGSHSGINPNHHPVWSQWILQNIPGGTNMLDCPTASKPKEWAKNESYPEYGFNAYGSGTSAGGFGLGGHIKSDTTPAGSPEQAVKESEVTSPSDTYELGDGFVGAPGIVADGSWVLGRWRDAQDRRGSTERSKKRHVGRATIAFCDGHAEAIRLPQLFEDNSDEALSRWNRDHLPHRETTAP